jgi:hypothetical protein
VNYHAHAPRDLRLLRKRMLTTATLQHLHAIACRFQGCAHWVALPQVQWPHAACALTLTDSERVVPASGEYRVHAPADAAAASAKTDKSLTVVIASTPPYSVEHCCSPAQRPCCQALSGDGALASLCQFSKSKITKRNRMQSNASVMHAEHVHILTLLPQQPCCVLELGSAPAQLLRPRP